MPEKVKVKCRYCYRDATHRCTCARCRIQARKDGTALDAGVPVCDVCKKEVLQHV